MEDAYDIVQSFLDEAIVVGVKRLEILHGKGSGILRNIVKEKAREYAQISRINPSRSGVWGRGYFCDLAGCLIARNVKVGIGRTKHEESPVLILS